MANDLALRRARRTGPLISLVPMIDVMLILLVFFMVTSTYLNLDMIPAVKRQDQASIGQNGSAETVLIRLAADGIPVLNGKSLTLETLATVLRERSDTNPTTQVLLLPSGAATTQSLISVMDIATRSGVERLRVIRLEAKP